MRTHSVALALVASTAIISGCASDVVAYNPTYRDVVYTSDYGTYPSYYWGYQNDYSPVYAVGAYRGAGAGYYAGWGGYRGGWGGYRGGWGGHHGGWGGHRGGWGGHHGGRR